jgi:hypothetical protein
MSKKFIPFANEADVLHIGRLQIENRLDRVTVSGDVDLTLDQAGLANAKALHQLLGDVVAKLESLALPAQLATSAVKTVKNPFD